jgi:transketolase
VYTLIGDGEANEGSTWEAVMVATNLRLNNLTILYDSNRSQVRSLHIPNPAERFAAFGCDVSEVDGHDLTALKTALAKPAETVKAVVAQTIKGYGCATLVNNVFEWHRKSPTPEQLEQLIKELDAA